MMETVSLRSAGIVCRTSLETFRSTHQQLSWPAELLLRFDYWAEEAGLFAYERQSLEHQIRRNAEVDAMVRQFLGAIHADIELFVQLEHTQQNDQRSYDCNMLDHVLGDENGIHEDDEILSASDIRSRIKDNIVRLIRLTRQMRQHLKTRLDREADDYYPEDDDDKALLQEFSEHIIWKLKYHPDWKVEDEIFRNRLQETMLRRGRRILFYSTRARRRVATLAKPTTQDLHQPHKPKALSNPIESTSREAALVMRPGRKIESVGSEPSKSMRSTGMTISSSYKPLEDQRSIASTKRTQSLLGVSVTDFPKAPAIPPGLTKFMCSLCDSWQPSVEREHKHWQSHVLRDLAPYICLYVRCPFPYTIYRTSKEWFAHMDTMHKENFWLCRLCQREFQDEIAFREHISDRQNHDIDIDLSPGEVAMLVKMNVAPSNFSSCYFCSTNGSDDDGIDLRLHMAEHLRSFALHSIPWFALASNQSDNDSKSALAGAGSRAGNSSTARIENFVDEIELSFDDGERAKPMTRRENDLHKAKYLLAPDERERTASIVLWNLMQPEPQSSMLDPNSYDGDVERPNLSDALVYFDQVKTYYDDRPDVYNSFLDILKDFKSGAIDTPGVSARIGQLFSGNHQLIQSFNAFLLPWYRMESETEAGVDDLDKFKLTTTDSTMVQPIDRPPGPGPQTGRDGAQPDQTQTQAELKGLSPHALGLFYEVRCRFANHPDTLNRLLEIFKSFTEASDIVDAIRMACELLVGHVDLIRALDFIIPRNHWVACSYSDPYTVIVRTPTGESIHKLLPSAMTGSKTVLVDLVDSETSRARSAPVKLDITSDDSADSILAKVQSHSGWLGDVEFFKDGISFQPTFEAVHHGMKMKALRPSWRTLQGHLYLET